jgi:hypothetical protein
VTGVPFCSDPSARDGFHEPNLFLKLKNEEWARKFLQQKYEDASFKEPGVLAYKNVQSFVAYIRQACSLFQTAGACDQWMQPLLLYYGMMDFFKAWILTKDPDYPKSTAVLRHGLSTRKRKKEPFRFSQDEIRIQKEGLFPYLAELMELPVSAGDSYRVKELLGFLPELQPTYRAIFGECTWFPVDWIPASSLLIVPEKILDQCHLAPSSFVEKLNAQSGEIRFSLHHQEQGALYLNCFASGPPHRLHPWIKKNKKGDHYLYTGNHRPHPLPRVISLMMLCFSMSMLCRYDPPLWEEIMLASVHQEQLMLIHLTDLILYGFPRFMAPFWDWPD